MKEAQPNKSSVLAAEKEARFLLPENATPAQIRAKTAELLNKKYTGVTYGPEAEYSRLLSLLNLVIIASFNSPYPSTGV